MKFRELIKGSGSLLDLSGQPLTPSDIYEISQALVDYENPELKELYLRDIGPESLVAVTMAPALAAKYSSLTCLSLCDNNIGDTGAAWLAFSLLSSTCTGGRLQQIGSSSLLTLRLKGNRIGDEGVAHLAHALSARHCSLTTLWLNSNCIGAEGAAALAEALKVNRTLTRLDLDSNRIGNAGATSLAHSLAVNKTMNVVFMSDNDIEDDGAVAIADALKMNCTLKEVVMSNNKNITIQWPFLNGPWGLRNERPMSRGAQALSDALLVNTSLLRFEANNDWRLLPDVIEREPARIEFLQSPEFQRLSKFYSMTTQNQ